MVASAPYTPVACVLHERLEFAVPRRLTLHVRWIEPRLAHSQGAAIREGLHDRRERAERKAHGAQRPRHNNELGEGASTAQRSDPFAQQVVQTFHSRFAIIRHEPGLRFGLILLAGLLAMAGTSVLGAGNAAEEAKKAQFFAGCHAPDGNFTRPARRGWRASPRPIRPKIEACRSGKTLYHP